ncbi:MAG TPA: SIS domain-containing protein [Geminicoccus sp.]|uniref:SIS domain-containing protein n=1 Tax=Geminicoccus sp. TaxID=2024832 RepID=UPI002E328DB3|nr:SIS domain-containing protein [Geminicoccus sp.]HEX2528042.1 SIS domain-containing protein [Geminicoccus sp.]
MEELATYVAKAKQSLYFSGAVIERDLGGFLKEHTDAAKSIGKDLSGKIDGITLIGSGGSWATLQTAKYALDGALDIPVECYFSFDLLWRQPRRIDGNKLFVFASYSGETDDVVRALRFAKSKGARTLGLVGKGGSTIDRECDHSIVYENGAIFEIPVAALILLAQGLQSGSTDELAANLPAIPAALGKVLAKADERAEADARRMLSATSMMVLGAGPHSPLAYKVALTVVMENIRINGTYCDAAEFRHGPAEAFERLKPDMMFFLGKDQSRETTEMVLRFCEKQGARTVVYDANDYGDVHPLLAPLVTNSLTQYFTVYSAILRGITDLDPRVFMGHGVLNAAGASWP